MSAEQIDLFDILFPTPKDSICKNLKEAVKNECGVFIEQNVMFQGGSYGEGERVVITIARKSPFIYYSFSCETRIQGRSHPCTENPSSRFSETDSRDCVMGMIAENLELFCDGVGIKHKTIDKALSNMREFI